MRWESCNNITLTPISGVKVDTLASKMEYATSEDVIHALRRANVTINDGLNVKVSINRSKDINFNPLYVANGVVSYCTLMIWPLYENIEFSYEFRVTVESTKPLVVDKRFVLDRYACASFFPLPWLMRFKDADFYSFDMNNNDTYGRNIPHVQFVEYEANFLAKKVLEVLSDPVIAQVEQEARASRELARRKKSEQSRLAEEKRAKIQKKEMVKQDTPIQPKNIPQQGTKTVTVKTQDLNVGQRGQRESNTELSNESREGVVDSFEKKGPAWSTSEFDRVVETSFEYAQFQIKRGGVDVPLYTAYAKGLNGYYKDFNVRTGVYRNEDNLDARAILERKKIREGWLQGIFLGAVVLRDMSMLRRLIQDGIRTDGQGEKYFNDPSIIRDPVMIRLLTEGCARSVDFCDPMTKESLGFNDYFLPALPAA